MIARETVRTAKPGGTPLTLLLGGHAHSQIKFDRRSPVRFWNSRPNREGSTRSAG